MSIRIMAQVWELDLPPTDKLVLLAIADHASDDGTDSWPSMDTLARKASVSTRQVRRITRRLEEAGWITVELQDGGDHRVRPDRRPNRYTVTLDGRTSVSPRGDDGRTSEAEREDMGGTNGRTWVSPKPSLEPSLEPPNESVPSAEDTTADFEAFWQSYPKRNGKRLGRRVTLERWRRLSAGEREDVAVGAEYYADAVARDLTIAKDPERWLRGRCWEDWLEPAESDRTRGPSTADIAAEFAHRDREGD